MLNNDNNDQQHEEPFMSDAHQPVADSDEQQSEQQQQQPEQQQQPDPYLNLTEVESPTGDGGAANKRESALERRIQEANQTVTAGIAPVVDPFRPAPISCAGYIKMVFVGLVLLLPRAILTFLIVLVMYFTALFACGGCCMGELTPEGFPKYPNPRYCLRLILRIWCRILLFVWGYYWIEVESHYTDSTEPGPNKPDPAVLVISPHSGVVDSLVAFTMFGASFVGKSEALNVPIIGRITSALQFIAVSRTNPNSRKDVANEITRRARWAHDNKKGLEEHGNFSPIALFPEATCVAGNATIQFKRGAFTPMVPVTAICIEFPVCGESFGGHHDWVGVNTLGGVLVRTWCQIFNRVRVLKLGVVAPDSWVSPPGSPSASLRDNSNISTVAEAVAAADASGKNVLEHLEASVGSGSGAADNGGGMLVRQESVGMISANSEDTMTDADRFAEKVRHLVATTRGVPLTEHSYDDVRLDYAALAVFGPSFHVTSKFATGKGKMRYKDCKELLDKFAQFNKSKTGKLNKAEFVEFLGLDEKKDKEAINILFERSDVDGDGCVDFAEVLQTAAAAKLAQIRSAVAVATSEGGVEQGELVRSQSAEMLNDAFVGVFWPLFDKEPEDVISRSSFFRGVAKIAPSLDPLVVNALFDTIDAAAKKDGVISIDDLVAYSKATPAFLNFVADSLSKNDYATNL